MLSVSFCHSISYLRATVSSSSAPSPFYSRCEERDERMRGSMRITSIGIYRKAHCDPHATTELGSFEAGVAECDSMLRRECVPQCIPRVDSTRKCYNENRANGKKNWELRNAAVESRVRLWWWKARCTNKGGCARLYVDSCLPKLIGKLLRLLESDFARVDVERNGMSTEWCHWELLLSVVKIRLVWDLFMAKVETRKISNSVTDRFAVTCLVLYLTKIWFVQTNKKVHKRLGLVITARLIFSWNTSWQRSFFITQISLIRKNLCVDFSKPSILLILRSLMTRYNLFVHYSPNQLPMQYE